VLSGWHSEYVCELLQHRQEHTSELSHYGVEGIWNMSAILTLSHGPSKLSGGDWELIVRHRDSCRGSPNMAMKLQEDYRGAIAGSGAAMTSESKEGDRGDAEADDQR